MRCLRRGLAIAILVAFLCPLSSGEAWARPRRKAHPARQAKGKLRGKPRPPVADVTRDGRPNVMSTAAVVVDLDTGEELFAKNPESLRLIASVGKLWVALVVRGKDLPLSGHTTITEEDRASARGGARSRLLIGKTFTNHDLLRAMLVASDNRAVTAVARAAGLSPKQLVSALNDKARELGLKKTAFTDPTGLNGNVSTPRETAVALRAALGDPVLAEILATHSTVVTSVDEPRVAVSYVNTNVSLRAGRYDVLGGKTGYTDEARYCLAIAARLGERRIGMVFLGAEGELTRFADFNRSAGWLVSGGPEKSTPKEAHEEIGASADPLPPALTPRLAR